MKHTESRFQDQLWPIRLWRYRHYLPVPFKAYRYWKTNPYQDMSFKNVWSMYIGLAQIEMRWWHTSEELKERLNDR